MRRARTEAAKDERRQVLLEAALSAFYERGFAAARMDDIAARAGLSKGTLYLYFKSKEDLFKSLIETFAIPNLERMESVALAAPSVTEAIRAIVRLAPVIIRQSDIPRLMKVLISDAATFPDVVQVYKENVMDRFLSVISGMLKTASEAGDIEIDDPELTARLVVAPFVFSAVWRVVFSADHETDRKLETLFMTHANLLEKALAPASKEVG